MGTYTYSNNWNWSYWLLNYDSNEPALVWSLSPEGNPYIYQNVSYSGAGTASTNSGNDLTITGGIGDDGYVTYTTYYEDGSSWASWEGTHPSGSLYNFAHASGTGSSAMTTSNTITFSGHDGDDYAFNGAVAYSISGGESTVSNNVTKLSGGLGADALGASYVAYANGGRATVSGNSTIIDSGDGDDGYYISEHYFLDSDGREYSYSYRYATWSGISAVSNSYNGPSDATATHNSISYSGGAANDTHVAYLQAVAYYSSTASIVDNNIISLTGDSGHDDLGIHLYTYSFYGGNSTTTGNVVTLDGGEGDDILRFASDRRTDENSTTTIADNVITLDGGVDNDRAVFQNRLDRYGLERNADGSLAVTDQLSGAVITAKNIESFDFGGDIYTLQELVATLSSTPVAESDTESTDQDTILTVTAPGVLGNDSDADGDVLAVSAVNGDSTKVAVAVTLASGALVTVQADGSYAYDTMGVFDYLGLLADGSAQTTTDSFTYTVSDDDGNTATETVTITVAGLNDAPTAAAETAAVDEDQQVLVYALANDADPDTSDLLRFASASAESGSSVSFGVDEITGDRVLVYTADADVFDTIADGATMTDTVTYTVSDGRGGTATETVTVTVSGVADGVSIEGTNQADVLHGTGADESIIGGNAIDELRGSGGADRLIAGNGDDALFGDNGWDELFGDRGDDVLNGGRGRDSLTGGLGADLFDFGSHVVDGTEFGTGTDRIADFQIGVDAIRLLDGVTVLGVSETDVGNDGVADTVLSLSNGGTVQLLGVSGLAEWDGLFV